jgi:predicted DNA-binding transcriptional regulator YafY
MMSYFHDTVVMDWIRRLDTKMRADRLLSILLLLQVHRRITAGELARRLEVSERTIHRDMEDWESREFPSLPSEESGEAGLYSRSTGPT